MDSAERENMAEDKKTKKETKKGSGKLWVLVLAIVLAAGAAGALWWFSTADTRAYAKAVQLYQDGQFQQALEIFTDLGDYEDSKAWVAKCEYALTTDGGFLISLGQGVSDWIQYEESNTPENSKYYLDLVDLEFSRVSDYETLLFDDSKLQNYARDYIENLNDLRKAVGYYGTDQTEFTKQWEKYYNRRLVHLWKIDSDYGFEDNEVYTRFFEELPPIAQQAQEREEVNFALAEILQTIKVETVDEDGVLSHSCILENKSDLTFKSLTIHMEILDSDGNIVTRADIGPVENWQPGQTVKPAADFGSDVVIDGSKQTFNYTADYEIEK